MRSLEQIMRYALRPCAIALCLTALGNQVTVAAPTSEIESLTVAFLYNFMKLSEWPSGTDTQELTLCAVQAGDYSIDVDSLAGKNVQDYSLKIKHLVPGDSPSGCQLLFISDDEKPIRVQEWLKNFENSPVLTVSGVPGFLDQAA